MTRLCSVRLDVAPFFLLLGLSLGLNRPAYADPAPHQTRAARLTYEQGTVTVNEVNGPSNLAAQLNMPLFTGTEVATGDDGQAEVEFEDGSVVRLTPNSALSLDNLAVGSDGGFDTHMSLLHGLAYAELRAASQSLYVLNAGGDVISPVENATIRVNYDEPPPLVAVLDGTAHVEHASSNDDGPEVVTYQTDVRAGESVSGDVSDPNRYFLQQVIEGDTWDQWNEDMDRAAAAQASNSTDVRNNYSGSQGYGWSDLDANGTWYDVPGTGPIWQPYGADQSDWEPYDNGAWVSYPGFGYVWASAYPWGWTPYRCGNWSYFGGFGWGWAPGASCGAVGWGFAGGGRPVNIAVGRPGHPPVRVPSPGHGPERPLVKVHNGPLLRPTARPTGSTPQPRQIAGVTARPVRQHENGFASSGGPVIGSTLRRDFPVDMKTKTAIHGLASTRPAAVRTAPAWQPPYRPNPPALGSPTVTPGQSRTAPVERRQPICQQPRQNTEAPHHPPAPQGNAPRASWPQQQSAPRYSPPPSPRPASHPSPSSSNAQSRAPR